MHGVSEQMTDSQEKKASRRRTVNNNRPVVQFDAHRGVKLPQEKYNL